MTRLSRSSHELRVFPFYFYVEYVDIYISTFYFYFSLYDFYVNDDSSRRGHGEKGAPPGFLVRITGSLVYPGRGRVRVKRYCY